MFKKGDIVQCVDNCGNGYNMDAKCLNLYSYCRITHVNKNGDTVRVNGSPEQWSETRFKMISSASKFTLALFDLEE